MVCRCGGAATIATAIRRRRRVSAMEVEAAAATTATTLMRHMSCFRWTAVTTAAIFQHHILFAQC